VYKRVTTTSSRGRETMGLLATAILCVVSGLVFLAVPHLGDAQFATLTHVAGKIEAVNPISPRGSVSPSVSVVLANASGKHSIRIDTHQGHTNHLARLSLGANLDAWVDRDATGAMFAWQIERNGEVLVGYKDRLESSHRLQKSLSFVGWPLLGLGGLLVFWAYWRMKAAISRRA